jgi:hypothetical protein
MSSSSHLHPGSRGPLASGFVAAFVSLVVASIAGPAAAQPIGVTNPVIRLQPNSPLSAAEARINIADVEAKRKVFLEWTATVGFQEPYEFELTYDRDVLGANTPTSTAAPPVVLDPAEEQFQSGTVVSGFVYRFPITVDRVIPRAALPGGANAGNARRSMFVSVYARSRKTDPNRFGVASASWGFEYDTKAPTAPTITPEVQVGDGRVAVAWTTNQVSTEVDTWEVRWASGIASSTRALTVADLPNATTVSFSQLSYGVTEGLSNGTPVAVAVRGIDRFGNKGPLSDAVFGTPVAVDDFFKLYKKAGGEEEGGFCFVATAAHGSDAHPLVASLRAFRDAVLETTGPGGALTYAYYRASPPRAAEIAGDPERQASARVLVALVSAFVALVLALGLGAVVLGLVALARAFRGRADAGWSQRASRGGRVTAGLALVVLVGVASPASARPAREPPTGAFGLGFEFKGGPYLPALAQDTATAPGFDQFRLVFGEGGGSVSPNPLYRLGLDLQLFRGRYGTAGLGGSFGLMQFVGKGYFPGTGQRSTDTTVFNLAPLELTAFYRLDVFADRTGIPIVPYVRGGLAYDLWWVTVGNGDISRLRAPNAADDVIGRGAKLGLTATAGVSILLNFIDSGAARNLYHGLGIRGTYVFAEVNVRKVDGFGAAGFDFSDQTWSLGLYFER